MAASIPDSHRDLFDKKAFAHLGTLMPDGSPQVTPVWCSLDGEHVVVNSAKGRRKDKNMRADARVAIELSDPDIIGTMLTVQTSLGFLLTILTIHLIPELVDLVGWGWAFAFLAIGPFLGVIAMGRLRALPEALTLANGNR